MQGHGRWLHRPDHDLLEQVFNAVPVEQFVIGLIEVAEQTIVTGSLTLLCSVFSFAKVGAGIRIKVAQCQGRASNPNPGSWIFDQLPQNTGSAFCCFIQQ